MIDLTHCPHCGHALDAAPIDWPTYLKALRARTGVSQRAFAHAIGTPLTTVRNWEQSIYQPSPAKRAAIAAFEEQHR